LVEQNREDENGQVWYRLNEKFGSGDLFWAQAEAFRPLTPEDMSPLSPEVEDKRIEVNINYQRMACFEGNTEVYFAKVSTGALYNSVGERVDAWGTPIGEPRIWRKTIWVHFISVGGSPKKREGWGMYIPHPSLFFGRFNSHETHPNHFPAFERG
jgi:hypothetical protein